MESKAVGFVQWVKAYGFGLHFFIPTNFIITMTKFRLITFCLLIVTILLLGRENWVDIGLGAGAQWVSNNYDALLILPSAYPPRQGLATLMADEQANLPFQVGRMVGSMAVILQGIMEIANGGRRVQVGVLTGVETMGFGGVVAVSGVVEGLHGAVVTVNGVYGLVDSGGNILNMAGKGGGGKGNYRFTDTKGLAKRLGVHVEEIHDIKEEILMDEKILPLLKTVGSNPDIGWNDAGNIILKSRIDGKTVETDVLLDFFARK